MSTHEEAFGIPSGHTLKQTRYSARGTVAENEDWSHDELDAEGKLVARYDSWHHVDVSRKGTMSAGFKKYAPNGELLQTSDKLFD